MPAVFVTTADAVDREAAWLNTTGDGLPALVLPDGRWDLIQAYQPRTPARRKNQIWVLRSRIRMGRFAMVRKQPTYAFRLRCWWTVSSGQGAAEDDQRAFDLAIDDVLTRLNGFGPGGSPAEPGVANKTHGGRFKAVGEDPGDIDVNLMEPDRTIVADASLYAEIIYAADDPDFDM